MQVIAEKRPRRRGTRQDYGCYAELKSMGYATGQFGKNHLGDHNEFLPTVHGVVISITRHELVGQLRGQQRAA